MTEEQKKWIKMSHEEMLIEMGKRLKGWVR